VTQLGELPVEVELVVLEGVKKHREELSTEHATQDVHGKEEALSSRDPAFTVEAETTSWNNAVQMRMSEQVLSPGME